jgi:hypothetical protein
MAGDGWHLAADTDQESAGKWQAAANGDQREAVGRWQAAFTVP